jgi:hypothetical protein
MRLKVSKGMGMQSLQQIRKLKKNHNSEYYSTNVSEYSTDAYPQCSSKYCRTESTQPFQTNVESGPSLFDNVIRNFLCVNS